MREAVGNINKNSISRKLALSVAIRRELLVHGVTDEHVIEAISGLDRYDFLVSAYKTSALSPCVSSYCMMPHGAVLVPPLMLAAFIRYAEISKEDKVMDLGCASGWTSVVLSMIARHVVALGRLKEALDVLRHQVNKLQIKNITIVHKPSNLRAGSVQHMPFDVILCQGAVCDSKLSYLFNQLEIGGRLMCVAPISPLENIGGKITKYVKVSSSGRICLHKQSFEHTLVPYLKGLEHEDKYPL